MKRIRFYLCLTAIVLMAFLATSCAKSSNKSSYDGSTSDSVAPEMGKPEETTNGAGSSFTDDKADGELANSSAISSELPDLGAQDKIIRRVNMDVETQDFDDLITTIDSQIEYLGGYVEKSDISGRRYYNSGNETRYGNIVARIPKDKLNEFINTVKEVSNVVNKNESTENVTLQYVDAESHKKSLEIEQERLLALLGKTGNLEDILVLESRLSDVRYQLQNYEMQLRTYDNLVEYSTVTITIREVERITPKTEEKQSVWDRIQTGFGDTMYNISKGLQNFFVWFVVNLPYLIIWAVIITIIVLISKRIYRKIYLTDNKTNRTGSGTPGQGTTAPSNGRPNVYLGPNSKNLGQNNTPMQNNNTGMNPIQGQQNTPGPNNSYEQGNIHNPVNGDEKK